MLRHSLKLHLWILYRKHFELLLKCSRSFIEPPAVAERVLLNRVWPFCPSIGPSVCLGIFEELSHFFSKFCLGARNWYEVVYDSQIFQKNLFALKIGEIDPKWVKKLFFLIYWKMWLFILMNKIQNENLDYLLCSSANLIFGKIFVCEIWAKMFLANQIARFLKQPFLQSKSVK